MSNLSTMPIKRLRIDYKLTALLETGTDTGISIKAGIEAGYKKILSCEILEKPYLRAVEFFKDYKNVSLFHGASVDVLPQMLEIIEGQNTLFWLDAHVAHGFSADEKHGDDKILPLKDEITIIQNHRDTTNDVIIIDDLVFHCKEFYIGDGWWEQHVGKGIKSGFKSIHEIMELFPTHTWGITQNPDIYIVFIPYDEKTAKTQGKRYGLNRRGQKWNNLVLSGMRV